MIPTGIPGIVLLPRTVIPSALLVKEVTRFPGRTACDIAKTLGAKQTTLGSKLYKLCQQGRLRRELKTSPYFRTKTSWHYYPGQCIHQLIQKPVRVIDHLEDYCTVCGCCVVTSSAPARP